MGGAAYTWLLYLTYVYFLLNDTNSDVNNGILITKATGSTSYITPLLHFRFCKPVYYRVDYSDILPHSTEICDFWVGIAKHVGHAITFKVLTDDTQNILFHYNLRSSE